MSSPERASYYDGSDPSFEMGGFDVNLAFQEAAYGVVSDAELALEEKIRRMENIVREGSSAAYREFVDFRSLAAQIELLCTHQHELQQALHASEVLSTFMDNHTDEHDHAYDSDYEVDPKTGKRTKKKKRYGWFSALVK